jgi:hypothetical protein
MNPLLIEGGKVLSSILIEASKNVTASQLARYGLLKSPWVGAVPILGGVASGALITAFAIPTSRRWILESSTKAAGELKRLVGEQVESARQHLVMSGFFEKPVTEAAA